MTTYQEEPWALVCHELLPYFTASWLEVEASEVPELTLNPDFARYDALAAQGALQLITAREDQRLLGYHLSVVYHHLHYQGVLAAHTDTFYLLPAQRKGWTAYRLLQAVEAAWRRRGVQVAIVMGKQERPMNGFFQRLGWQASEQTYVKRLKEDVWG